MSSGLKGRNRYRLAAGLLSLSIHAGCGGRSELTSGAARDAVGPSDGNGGTSSLFGSGGDRGTTRRDPNDIGEVDDDRDGVPDSSDLCPGFSDRELRVLEGDIVARTQGEVDALAGVVEITGSLNLGSYGALLSEVTSIDSLSCLQVVRGTLELRSNTFLVRLDDFSSLTRIGAGLYMTENVALADVDGFGSLTNVGGDIIVSDNTSLASVAGFSSLTSIGVGLYVSDNDSLKNMDGFSSLLSVGENLRIFNNGTLVNVDGFSSLTSVGGGLYVSDNALLTNMDGFASLDVVQGNLAIYSNSMLPTCEAESLRDSIGLQDIGGVSDIAGNDDTGVCP